MSISGSGDVIKGDYGDDSLTLRFTGGTADGVVTGEDLEGGVDGMTRSRFVDALRRKLEQDV